MLSVGPNPLKPISERFTECKDLLQFFSYKFSWYFLSGIQKKFFQKGGQAFLYIPLKSYGQQGSLQLP